VVQYIQKGRGTQFDPSLVDLFLDNLDRFRGILGANPDEPHDEDPGI